MVGDEIWPGANVSTVKGSNSFDEAIRAQARSIFQSAGTCAMVGTLMQFWAERSACVE